MSDSTDRTSECAECHALGTPGEETDGLWVAPVGPWRYLCGRCWARACLASLAPLPVVGRWVVRIVMMDLDSPARVYRITAPDSYDAVRQARARCDGIPVHVHVWQE